jgi:hypothetical protein
MHGKTTIKILCVVAVVSRSAVLSNIPVISERVDNDCYLGAGTFVPHALTHAHTYFG